ncbi:MAG: hypothetical protein HYX25_08970 [Candidatus Solibacter usitatus]|nr:hypothetical protein [Candidatus Solibacter usitatus]
MRQALSFVLALLMVSQMGPVALGADSVTNQITGMRAGTNIEVHLKNKQTLRGARGEVSGSGFTLLNSGAVDRQLVFDDVASVKQLDKKSHTTRNVLIVVGIGLVAAVAVVAIHVKKCPLGC